MTSEMIFLKDYRKPNFALPKTRLQFDLDSKRTIVRSWLEINDLQGELFLHGEDLVLKKIMIDEQELTAQDYHIDKKGLYLTSATANFTLHIEVEICPADNTRLEGLYQTGQHLMTQCEAEGFRRITYYPDRPDMLANFEVALRAAEATYPLLLAGGNLVEEGTLEDGRVERVFHDPHPKPCYLFALVAGDFDVVADNFTTKEGQDVALFIHVDKGNATRAEFAIHALKKAMKWDEENYNFCYDLKQYHIVAANDFNMGAMENKGLNIFNARLVLASALTATDTDYEMIDRVIAHEYFHNWTGNRITCRDWFQLSLKEGLTVFREQQYGEAQSSALEERIDGVGFLRNVQFPEDAGATSHPVRPESYLEINNFYTATIYEKGAELIRMLKILIGDDGYYRAIETYRTRHDGQAVTCDDFVQAMQSETKLDLTPFKLWYSQAGTPEIEIAEHYEAGNLQLTISQKLNSGQKPQSPPKPMMMPIGFAIFDKDTKQKISIPRKSQNTNEDILILDQQVQKFSFDNVPTNYALSLNRSFSAPIKLKGNIDWEFIANHDDDDFNRWDAKEHLITNWFAAHIQGALTFDQLYGKTKNLIGQILDRTDSHPALWSLPSFQSTLNALTMINPSLCHRTLAKLRQKLAQDFADIFMKIYQTHESQAGLDYPQGRVARLYRHSALGFLGWVDAGLVKAHYDNARNMTENFAALQIAQNIDAGALRTELMADFLAKWQGDRLVMNKWLRLQGGYLAHDDFTAIGTIARDDAVFDIKNPNNVYSLLGGLVSDFTPAYHADDGRGYQFFGEFCQKLDGLNPQVAARLVKMGLKYVEKLSPNSQAHIVKMLDSLLNRENCSPDMHEITKLHFESLRAFCSIE